MLPVAGIGALLSVGVGVARADVILYTTGADWGGSAGYAGTSGETGWNGWGAGPNYPSAANAPTAHYYDHGALPLTFTTSLDTSTTNGVGNFDNLSNSTGTAGDDNYGETKYGGATTTSGGVTAATYTGGYFSVTSGDVGANSSLTNALIARSGGNLAVDFTLPGGATSLPNGAYQSVGVTMYGSGFTLASGAGTAINGGTGQANFGSTAASPGANTDGNTDGGSYVINNGNGTFTAVLPYTFTAQAGVQYPNGNLYLYYNSGNGAPTGTVTLDNLRILVPAAVPEPASLGLLASAAGGLAARRRRKA